MCLQSIASAALYLASKVQDETVRLRDLINVCYHTLYRDAAPLRLAEDYWNFRDSIVHAEMLVMRVLQFDTTFDHPHNVIYEINFVSGHFRFRQFIFYVYSIFCITSRLLDQFSILSKARTSSFLKRHTTSYT